MKRSIRSFGIHPGILVTLLAGGIFLAGCAHFPDNQAAPTPPAVDKIYTPPKTPSPPVSRKTAPDIPENLLAPGSAWQLADIIDVALRNSPDTKAAWHTARAAAADFLSQEGTYFPELNASATGKRVDVLTSEKRSSDNGTNFIPAVELTYLLFDFGGRQASLDEKRRALLSANFLHTAAVQDQVLQAIQGYFNYGAAKALEVSLTTSLAEAATSLDAAEEKHSQGLATIADVLQAKTARSQAQLSLEAARRNVQTLRGSLATAMGIPVSSDLDIAPLSEDPPVDQMANTVEEYLKTAEKNNPNLLAQREQVEKSLALVRSTRSSRYPTLSFSSTTEGLIGSTSGKLLADNTAALVLSVPLWDHGTKRYNELKAEEDAKAQAATLQSLEQSVNLSVWTSYYDLKTAAQQLRTTADLLTGAVQSYNVALGRYKEGVGGFLDLLTAQSTLANARAQKVAAQTAWYVAFSDLARNTGFLWSGDSNKNSQLIKTFQLTP
jgi:outer membrane protein